MIGIISLFTETIFFLSSLRSFLIFAPLVNSGSINSISDDLNIKAKRDITLKIGEEGETLILDKSGNVLLSYSKEQENFVSTITKVLERDRKTNGILKNSNVVLRLSQDNRLSIYDPQTEREIDLAGFG